MFQSNPAVFEFEDTEDQAEDDMSNLTQLLTTELGLAIRMQTPWPLDSAELDYGHGLAHEKITHHSKYH